MRTLGYLIPVLAFLLPACGGSDAVTPADRQDPIVADRMVERQDILVSPESGRPTLAGFDDVDRFLDGLGAGYGDRITIAGGSASSRRAVDRHLRGRGFFRAQDVGRSGEPLRIELSRIVLTPPVCGDWTGTELPDHSNVPPRNFGCADRSNLARMLADPHDLFTPSYAPATTDGARQATLVGALRANRLELTTTTTDSVTTGD